MEWLLNLMVGWYFIKARLELQYVRLTAEFSQNKQRLPAGSLCTKHNQNKMFFEMLYLKCLI
ncbi:hypothetical protein DN068_18515 [Taibaiella soli]|uniref:Uncharacterized protein n=1 Tax=Taibaiella soli TaxID=1649169 RepID=A0A2W2ACE4_9BACT|nr:hypothetical protein DN068_18515 [Taibaiella soli]